MMKAKFFLFLFQFQRRKIAVRHYDKGWRPVFSLVAIEKADKGLSQALWPATIIKKNMVQFKYEWRTKRTGSINPFMTGAVNLVKTIGID